jgi:hypothetical protein
MQDKSKREGIIQYANQLIGQNNDEIKKLKMQLTEVVDSNERKNITDKIEELNQSNRMLALRLEEPILSMTLELRELQKKAREATKKKDKEYFLKLASEKHDEILVREFDGDKNIGRFNKF